MSLKGESLLTELATTTGGRAWFPLDSQRLAFAYEAVAADVQQFPLADGQDEVPPSPRLQTQPFKDGYLLKERQDERLDSYGWTDKASGAVHIPIDRAIDLTLERGLPARQGEGEARPMVAQDSSSGRTSAPR